MDVLLSVEVERASNFQARAEFELLDEARTCSNIKKVYIPGLLSKDRFNH